MSIRLAIESALRSSIKPHKIASKSKKSSIKTATKKDVTPDKVMSVYLRFFDIKSKETSDGFAFSRLKPFEALWGARSDLNLNLRTMFEKIFLRRLYFIGLKLEKGPPMVMSSQNGARDPWFDEDHDYSNYELPGPFCIGCRQAKVNGVPGFDRVEDELVFDILRILELYLLNEAPEDRNVAFKRILDAPNVFLAMKEIEKDKLIPILFKTCPDSVDFFFPELNINKYSSQDLARFHDEKGVDDWRSLLFRLMLGIYFLDQKILNEVSSSKFIELLFEKDFDRKSEKMINSKITEYKKNLGIKSKYSRKLP